MSNTWQLALAQESLGNERKKNKRLEARIAELEMQLEEANKRAATWRDLSVELAKAKSPETPSLEELLESKIGGDAA